MLDITFCSEGKEIQAHRLVVAAVSQKCRTQWNGSFPIEPRIVFDEHTDPDCLISYHALSAMIDYAYESKINWSEMEVSDDDDDDAKDEKLQLLLNLHKGAQYWLIEPLMSQVEDKIIVAGKKFINIKNVVAIRDQAEYVGAKNVEKMCAKFIEQNHAVVEKASGRDEK
jgi:sacsin